MIGIRSRVTHVIVLAAALSTLGTPAAMAATTNAIHPNGFVMRHKDVHVGADSVNSATATCPSGDRVVNGGAYWLGSPPSLGHSWLGSSFPTADLKGWTASGAREFSARDLRVVVTCAPSSALPAYTVVVGRTNIPNRSQEKQKAVYCPANTAVVTGGTVFEKLDSSRKPKPGLSGITTGSGALNGAIGWIGLGRNIGGLVGTQQPMRLRVIAVCAKASKVGTYQVRGGNFPSDATTGGAANCDSGYGAVAGIAYWHASANGNTDPGLPGELIDSYPKLNGNGWVAHGYGTSGGDPEFSVIVFCVPR